MSSVGDVLEDLVKEKGEFNSSEQSFWVIFTEIHVQNQLEIPLTERQFCSIN